MTPEQRTRLLIALTWLDAEGISPRRRSAWPLTVLCLLWSRGTALSASAVAEALTIRRALASAVLLRLHALGLATREHARAWRCAPELVGQLLLPALNVRLSDTHALNVRLSDTHAAERTIIVRSADEEEEEKKKEENPHLLSIIRLYQAEVGPLTDSIRHQIKREGLRFPLETWQAGFEAAATHNARSWAYVWKCVRTWDTDLQKMKRTTRKENVR